jgi:capsular polysaccharide biosynthesis protein
MLTIRRVMALVCILVLLGAGAWIYGWLRPTYEAQAELRVRPTSELQLATETPNSRVTATDDRWTLAQDMAELVRSHSVITAALRQESIKSHPSISQQEDPVEYVTERLDVVPKRSGLITVRVTTPDPALCRDLANAIVDAFISRFEMAERQQQMAMCEKLEQQLVELTNKCQSCMAELDEIRRSDATANEHGWARVEQLKVEVEQCRLAANRAHEKLVDLRLQDVEVGGNANGNTGADVSGSWDRDNRQVATTRFKGEYDRNMNHLAETLAQLAAEQRAQQEQSSGSAVVEMRQHETARMRARIDELSARLADCRLLLQLASRVELLSNAEIPVSPRPWFGGHHNAD